MKYREGRKGAECRRLRHHFRQLLELCDSDFGEYSLMSSTPRSGDAPREFASSGSDFERESRRLKLLLDMTNLLVSNLEPRDLSRAISASIRQFMHCATVECPAVFVPVSKRETGMRGAINGAEEEVYAGADREPATAS
jgi:hypothetical protein